VERLREQGLELNDAAVRAGLAGVSWPARLEVVGRAPLVVLDCAHNVASARAVAETLRASLPLPPGGRRLLIFASSGDKDLAGMFEVLAPHFDAVLLTRFTTNPRSVSPEKLAEVLRRVSGLAPVLCATPTEAWQLARTAAAANDLIVVTGSVFLAGELRPLLIDGR
jgi:dihydrofolate synthase / folylpolyglutamate synthase